MKLPVVIFNEIYSLYYFERKYTLNENIKP